jgi:lactaldehyde dehydrogenase/glycolaldehyde dehydrogenase
MISVPITGHYIDGEWHEESGSVPVINPATEEELATIPVASKTQVNAALDAASTAQKSWQNVPGVERARAIREIGKTVAASKEAVAQLLLKEQGKPLSTARGEVAATIDLADYVAGWGRRIEGEIVPSDNRDEQIQLQRHPVGVVAAIIPWNYPIGVLMRKLLPALIAGNSLVIKPSSKTPLSTLHLIKQIQEHCDIPTGLINLLLGDGEVGEALVGSPNTDMVTMTGSTRVGMQIMETAAANLTPVSLELGGNAPAIVASDANIEDAVADVLRARITNAGQVCTCVERVYVHEAVAEEFTEKLVAAAQDLAVGRPEDDPDIGPQISQDELDWTTQMVEFAVQDGASIQIGGQFEEPAYKTGFYYQPTVLADASQEMDVVSEEIFGPVIPVIKVSSLDEAVTLANDSVYGLSSYLYTQNHRTAMRVSEQLEYGETYINRSLGEAWQGHHIGWKKSGLGGDDGKYGVLKYTRIKTVYHDYS